MKVPTGAGPAEGDELLEGTPPEEGAEEQPQAQEGQQQQAQQPQYLTREELNSTLDGFGRQLVQRIGQSTNARIQQQLAAYDRTVKLQAQVGAPIPEEAQQAARTAIRQGVVPEEPAAPNDGQQQAAPNADEAWPRYIADQMDFVFEDEKMEVSPSDPEWKKIEQALTDPKSRGIAVVLHVARQQAQAKKTRIASKTNKAPARAGAGGGSAVPPGDISSVNDPARLYEMGEERMRQGKR